jgi:DNA-binding NarL/FixJ family response regulator
VSEVAEPAISPSTATIFAHVDLRLAPPPLRVVFLGDGTLGSEVIAAALTQASQVELVAVTASDVEAFRRLQDQRGAVLLVEASRGPQEAVRRIVEAAAGLGRVVCLVDERTPQHISQLLAAGATSCVSTRVASGDFVAVLCGAASGFVFHNPPLPGPESELVGRLTPREVEILALAAEGTGNKQIAQGLWVTEQTVKFHLSNVYRKLDVANRTEASRWAQCHGLLSVTNAA